MPTRILPLVLVAALASALFTGCAMTVDDRIRREPEVFARFPADVQQRIRAGQVEIGDEADAVRLALGEPWRRLERTTAEGRVEVWIYAVNQAQPRLRFSVGVGTGGRHSAVGVGGAVTTGGPDPDEEAMRVEFLAGRVVRIETRKS